MHHVARPVVSSRDIIARSHGSKGCARTQDHNSRPRAKIRDDDDETKNVKRKTAFVLLGALALTGCATKNYGRMGNLTDYERTTMSCREIDLEIARVDGFVSHVDKESEFDGRSVLSFLGDFGIGNLMEKDSAMQSANERRRALDSLRASKQCGYATTAASVPAAGSAPAAASAASAQ